MKVCFETFGCRLNKAEALQMEAEYLAKGWEVTDRHRDADLIIVRGCSVTARAQHDSEKLVDHLRRHYPMAQVRACGCLKKDDVAKAKTDPILEPAVTIDSPLPVRTARAYLKVQDGCAGKCTFCIVPKFRGTSVSVPFADVVGRAKRFIDAGYREIVVTGCNLSLYASAGKRLPELLAALSELAPAADCRIRLGSLEPDAVATDVVHVIAEHANICRFLHIPVQSGANQVLMSMKRPYFARDVDGLALMASKLIPNLRLGCDLITGFPGETLLDHRATVEMLRRLPFSLAHIFPYSERPGTGASLLSNAVPKAIRSARAHELSHLAKEKASQFARRFVGKEVEIVVESATKIVGRTNEYLWCQAIGKAPRKSFARIRVTKVHHDGTLGGEYAPAAS